MHASHRTSTPLSLSGSRVRSRPRSAWQGRFVAVALGATATLAAMGAIALPAGAAGSEDGPNPNTTAPSGTANPPASKPAATATTAPPTKAVIDPAKDPAKAYDAGKAAIEAQDWTTAITLLTGVTAVQPTNADAWNFLGYATRKNGNPTAAIPLYAKALALNPKHKGALEYQGEAYVQTNQMAKAKANLAALKKICGTKCEEYKDLAGFISSKGKKAK
jgi:Flp pilus assembly protein TadD